MTANTGSGRRGLDGSTILASIHAFDPSAGCDPITFQPCSDRALANVLAYIDSFNVFQTNYGVPKNYATAIGRYPEDRYMGGNVRRFFSVSRPFVYAFSTALVSYYVRRC